MVAIAAEDRSGRIFTAHPTPGVAVPTDGCAEHPDVTYAGIEDVLALPVGKILPTLTVPMTWAAAERTAALQARPIFLRCSIAVGAGWLTLLERLVDDLEALPGGAAIRASGVKEKFGGLRFYSHVDDDALAKLSVAHSYDGPTADDLIDAAEAASKHVCEWCGDAGHTVSIDGWYTTLCHRHQAVARLSRWTSDYHAWRHLLALPVDLPARPHLNAAWAAVMRSADQLQALGAQAIGLGFPGELRLLEPIGVHVGAENEAAREAVRAAVSDLLGGWPVQPYHRCDCQRLAQLDDLDIRRHAQLAAHPLMAVGAKVKLGCTEWLPIIERLLADLVAAGVPEGRIKAIRPAQDGRLSVHPKLSGEAGRLVVEAADRAAADSRGGEAG